MILRLNQSLTLCSNRLKSKMNNKFKFLIALLSISFFSVAQNNERKLTITGTIYEKDTDFPLEYATVVFEDVKTQKLSGGVTDFDGKFNFTVNEGTYNIRFEFISFKTIKLLNQKINSDKNFGKLYLEADVAQLSGVEVTGEKSTVEIKLDKRVYNVGSDMTVRGGTAGDVLNNVPSVTVDQDGTIALRGNESVTVLIDGKPSGLAGINIGDAVKMLPADAIDKVEVITNPSARYNAEGGGGIINIVLKKGKTNGLNGSFIVSAGDPETYGFNSSLNYKTNDFNVFSNFAYNYRTNLGEASFKSTFFDTTTDAVNDITGFLNEERTTKDIDNGYNANFGIDVNLNETTTWTNSVSFRRNSEDNPQNVFMDYFDANGNFTQTRNRNTKQFETSNLIEFASNLTKKFDDDEHRLTADFSVSKNQDNQEGTITDVILNSTDPALIETTINNRTRDRLLAQTDYVLPLGNDGRFEAGYRGDFVTAVTDFQIFPETSYNNLLEYVENVNALYMQYGNKINKFSYFLGLRWEDSHIEVNSFTGNDFNTKKYNNFFPTSTFNYEFNKDHSTQLSYSRRINRPRGRFINPFSTYSSNVNLFQGNPDLDPTFTHAIELGYLWKGSNFTLNSSVYTNLTDQSFQFVRRETGNFVDGVPVIVTTPINLAKEFRSGFEFNFNYSPYKWLRLNTNLNLFSVQTRGDFTYVNFNNETVTQNFDNDAFTLFTRLNAKVSLPYKIDWQSNIFYSAPQTTAQGKSLSMANFSFAFSKDVIKDKATLSMNINNAFNTMRRRFDTLIPDVTQSETDFMWRKRTILMSFTYRFNRKKESERNRREDGGGDDFMMG